MEGLCAGEKLGDVSHLTPPTSWLLTQEHSQAEAGQSPDMALHDAPTQVFDTQPVTETQVLEEPPATARVPTLLSADTLEWNPDELETQPLPGADLADSARQDAAETCDTSTQALPTQPSASDLAGPQAPPEDSVPAPFQESSALVETAQTPSLSRAPSEFKSGTEVTYMRFKRCTLMELCDDGTARIWVPGIGERRATASEWSLKEEGFEEPQASKESEATDSKSSSAKSPARSPAKKSPAARSAANSTPCKSPAIDPPTEGSGRKSLSKPKSGAKAKAKGKAKLAATAKLSPAPELQQQVEAEQAATPLRGSKREHCSPTVDEDSARKALGHELSPQERGQRVAVVGDGWGGGEGGYEAIVTEADESTFTVIPVTGDMQWQETHVLKQHCIGLCSAAVGEQPKAAGRRKSGKRCKSEIIKSEPAVAAGA